MTYRELLPIGRSGKRFRKAFVAGALLAITYAAWHLVRDPRWDGWWDAFNWAQLFLYAPVLFFFGAAMWQFLCFVAEYSYQRRKNKAGTLSVEPAWEEQRTLRFAYLFTLPHDLCNRRHPDGRGLHCDGSRMAFALVVVQRRCGLSPRHGRSEVGP
jgi:hypothetical protein